MIHYLCTLQFAILAILIALLLFCYVSASTKNENLETIDQNQKLDRVLHKIRNLKRTKEELERRCEQYEIQLQAQANCKDQEILAKLNLISYLNCAAEQSRHEIQTLRSQLANETEGKRYLKTAYDRLESKAKSQASHFEFEIESLRNQLAKETEEKRDLKKAREKLEKQVAAQTKKAKFDSSFRVACGEKIAELSERNSELRMEKAKLKEKLDAANEQIELKSQICKTLEESLESMEGWKDELKMQLSEQKLEREKNKLAESRESLRNELEHALLLKEDLELLCEELKTQLSEQKSESENKLAELQESMESLRNELERITIVNGDLQLFYKQLQVQAQAQISDDLERALYKEKESSIISQLNSSLAVAISEISYWQTKVVNLDAQLEELSHHKDRETNEICTLKKALQQARHEIQSLHSELVKETHENENLCEILNSVLFIQVPFRVKTCIASK